MHTKITDSKGRITLGERFANRTVIVEDIDETEVRVTLARVIPEREAWLYENKQAKELVMQGLEEARRGKFADAPDMTKARKVADAITDDSE